MIVKRREKTWQGLPWRRCARTSW